MSIRKTFAAIAAGSLLVTGLAVTTAGSAFAADDGPALTGHIYLLNATINMDTAKPSNVITGGNGSTRPWMTIASDTACPAGSIGVVAQVRIPQVGVDPINWDEVLMDSITQTLTDSQGRLYNPGNVSNMTAAKITAYVATQPNTTGTLPLALVCYDGDGLTTGYFSTDLTVTGTTAANLTWSVPAPPAITGIAPAVATTTALTAVASGNDLVLTATVTPSAAAGSVVFTEGSTTLATTALAAGSAMRTVVAPGYGQHTYKASFAPTDPAKFLPSESALLPVTVAVGTGGIVVTANVPAPAQTEPGSLTLTVPTGTPVTLSGVRDSTNSKVTAAAALPEITVTDTRSDALLTSWQVNVQASDFAAGQDTIGAKYLGWKPGLPSMDKSADPTSPLNTQAGPEVSSFMDASASTGLSVSRMLGESIVKGRGATKLGAQLNLSIPATTKQGGYASTITITLIVS